MTAPSTYPLGLDSAPTTHPRLLAWVREVAELTTPDRVVWVDGSDAEWKRLTAELVAAGTLVPLNDELQAELLLGLDRPDRRRAGRAAHVHLFGRRGRRRPDEQLDGAVGHEARDDRAVPGLHARPDDVRDPVLHGPADRENPMFGVEITDSAYVVLVHEDHDPDGYARPRGDG